MSSDWDQQADGEESEALSPSLDQMEGVADFDSETEANGTLDEFPNLIIGSVELPNYMAVGFPQAKPWHSVWEHRHPNCSKTDWELRIYHNTPREQYLGLYCQSCGKTVDAAEIINAINAATQKEI